MDPNRFDTLVLTFAATRTRRGLLHRLVALPLAGSLAVLLEREPARADGSGAIGGGGRRNRHRGKPNGNHHRHDHHRHQRHDKHDKPGSTCAGLGKPCSSDPGTQCCPETKPNVVCASGYVDNPDRICQDCSKAPKAAGALCQDPTLGNQCCDGNPECFVGVRFVDDTPACYNFGVCRGPGAQCSTDADCEGSLECVKGSSSCGCEVNPGEEPTYCGTPCS